ncbi:hypothetical protein [Ruficoccus sp. ZRK36]|uniref:hypothetical protein n=1 Tax=Ruficoccus sp. ZRK36 TaxID=2866311 RepID=UPI001C73A007|nr:hypothetical protein [Ruficoccus sp. ZRK36]QYY34646.1 hypothetical protein K0V07_10055 [Ruficoccus sp. ZRK36]
MSPHTTPDGEPSSLLGIRNAIDFYDQLAFPAYQDFLSRNGCPRHALVAIILAYHMYEWAHQEAFDKGKFLERYPKHGCEAQCLEYARLLANGSKHFNPKVKVETRKQNGFSSAFSDAYQRPLIVIIDHGKEISFDTILSTVMGFWNLHVEELRKR